MCLHHITSLKGAIGQLDERIYTLLATHVSEAGIPFAPARDRVDTITGVGKRAAECILAEVGLDMTRFRPPRTWPRGRAWPPGSIKTGGKPRSGRTTHADVCLSNILTSAPGPPRGPARPTWPLSSSGWSRRIDKKKAAIAVSHSILVICWHLLSDDRDYDDLGGDGFTRRNPDRQCDRLIAQLQNLGYRVTLDRVA